MLCGNLAHCEWQTAFDSTTDEMLSEQQALKKKSCLFAFPHNSGSIRYCLEFPHHTESFREGK